MKTLEELLRMEVQFADMPKIKFNPDFRVAVQDKTPSGVHIIIHAIGHDSETLDFLVVGNELRQVG